MVLKKSIYIILTWVQLASATACNSSNNTLTVFLEVCREKNIEPRRHYSGKFNLRIPADLHEKIAIAAQASGKSINTLAQEALLQVVQ